MEKKNKEMKALCLGLNMLGDYLITVVFRTSDYKKNLERWQKVKDEMRKFYD